MNHREITKYRDHKWLSVYIGAFGLWCLFRAAVCVYFLVLSDVSEKALRNFDTDTIWSLKGAYYVLMMSIATFALVAGISGISAYGVWKQRIWARKIWLSSCIVFFLYFILASCLNPSSLPDYILGFFLCIASWYILWYLPRKIAREDFLGSGGTNHV